jgi:hypothetical protein
MPRPEPILEEPSSMDQVLERIAAWEAAGVIDSATADRLRLAETERPSKGESATRPGPSSIASVFGPGVTIGEMFAYLGGAFLLGAYETFVFRAAGPDGPPLLPITIGTAIAAIALALLGAYLMKGDARRRRAAGVMFALAVAHIGSAGVAAAGAANLGWPAAGVIGAAAATLAAIAFRLVHPALLTQVALLASITSFAALLLSWLESVVFPAPSFDRIGEFIPEGGPDPLLLVAISAAWWLAVAVIIGLIGLREARNAGDDAAGRRAALTRLWAGLVAVIGLATSVSRSAYLEWSGYTRVVQPWVGDLAILVLSAILVERAFRRETSAYVYAAALGLMIALTDFNFTYLSSSTEVGLLIEGVILLAVGVGADRLRRRIGQSAPPSAAADEPAAGPDTPATPA